MKLEEMKALPPEEQKALYKRLGEIRKLAKATNYSATYGAGGAAIARAAGVSKKDGGELHKAYWERNWSIKEIPKHIKTKKEFGSMWLFNPVSKLWYSLRKEKDIWSTLNQSTGVWVFDTWVKHILSKRPQLTAQFHDEVVLCVKEGNRKQCEGLLRWAIDETNKELKMNREMDIDVQFGENYAEIH